MSSILDIDLDYFNLIKEPVQRLNKLLNWANCPVAFIVEKHHKSFARWKDRIKRETLSLPTHILHVDEHHDMMDKRVYPNIANFMYHAMRTWTGCHVHWLIDQRIDSPSIWLSDDVWDLLSPRFSTSKHCPKNWPKPDFISVCSSPSFTSKSLRQKLLNKIEEFSTRIKEERKKGRTNQSTSKRLSDKAA